MYDILNTDEFVEVDGRRYANPQLTIDESNQFIDNLRSTQQANNQEIQTQTYNLGTAVPSNLGGLTSPVTNGNGGAGLSYFTSRYQTPQTNATVANLRATAQAAALSQALQNEQEMWKKRYQDAYRKYQKSAYDKSNQPTTQNPQTSNDITTEDTTKEVVDITTDPIARSIYFRKLDEYRAQGLSTEEAEARVKEDMGLNGQKD